MKEFKELTLKTSALEYQLSEIQKSHTGTVKDAREFKEHSQYSRDFQNVMQVLDSQESSSSKTQEREGSAPITYRETSNLHGWRSKCM